MAAIEHSHQPEAGRAPRLFLCAAASASLLLALPVQAEQRIGYQTYKYVEAGGRMRVLAGDLSIEKDFGTDDALSVDIGHDAISGATPCWTLKPGYANEYQTGLCKVSDEARHSLGAAWVHRDTQRNEYTLGTAFSREPDFDSKELSAQGLFWDDASHNRAYVLGTSLQFNTAIATAHTNNTVDRSSGALNLQLGVNQVLDRHTTVELSVFAARDHGYLSNHYLKIVRSSASGQHVLSDDERPDSRTAAGVSARWIRAWRPDLTSNLFVRAYRDDWGVAGLTVEGRASWDINEQWRFNPVLRFNRQGAADFYRSYDAANNTFAASGPGSNDERLGAFRTTTLQLNGEYHASKDWTFNAGLIGYRQSTGLSARWLTAGFTLKY